MLRCRSFAFGELADGEQERTSTQHCSTSLKRSWLAFQSSCSLSALLAILVYSRLYSCICR